MTKYEENLTKIHVDAMNLVNKHNIKYDQALKIIEIQVLKYIQYYMSG